MQRVAADEAPQEVRVAVVLRPGPGLADRHESVVDRLWSASERPAAAQMAARYAAKVGRRFAALVGTQRRQSAACVDHHRWAADRPNSQAAPRLHARKPPNELHLRNALRYTGKRLWKGRAWSRWTWSQISDGLPTTFRRWLDATHLPDMRQTKYGETVEVRHQPARRKISEALVPPKPKEFDNTVLISRFRA